MGCRALKSKRPWRNEYIVPADSGIQIGDDRRKRFNFIVADGISITQSSGTATKAPLSSIVNVATNSKL